MKLELGPTMSEVTIETEVENYTFRGPSNQYTAVEPVLEDLEAALLEVIAEEAEYDHDDDFMDELDNTIDSYMDELRESGWSLATDEDDDE
jgi:hypothetical protein